MLNEPVSVGREARMIWPAGITAADMHVAIDYLDQAVSASEDTHERRSLMRVRDAIRNEYGNRKRAAIVAATPGGRRQRRRIVK